MKTSKALRLLPLVAGVALALPAVAKTESEHHIERQHWGFGGVRGQFDAAQLQRGFQVYQQVCSACHGLKRIYFRNLVQSGGPQFPEESVKALAEGWPNKIVDGPDDAGKMFDRAPKLADPILGPFKNDKEARAAFGGALPPDLSVMAKARGVEYTGSALGHPLYMLKDIVTAYQEGGADYIYALLTGYADKPPAFRRTESGKLELVDESAAGDGAGLERCASVVAGEEGKRDTCNALQDGMVYNRAFPGHQIAMPPPLAKEGFVKYQDNSGSLEDNARDVAAFLAWTADPSLNSRKYLGWQVMLYLVVTTLLLYIGKKRIWSRIEH